MRHFSKIINVNDESAIKELNFLETLFNKAIANLIKIQKMQDDPHDLYLAKCENEDIIFDLAAALIGKKVEIGDTAFGLNFPSAEHKTEGIKCECGADLSPVPGIHRCPQCNSICTVVSGRTIGKEDNLVMASCERVLRNTCPCCDQKYGEIPPGSWMATIGGWHTVYISTKNDPNVALAYANDPLQAAKHSWIKWNKITTEGE